MLISKWNIYPALSPSKAQGPLWDRGWEDYGNQRWRINTKGQCLPDRTYELTVVRTAGVSLVQAQAGPNPNIERRREYDVSPLAEELQDKEERQFL